MEYACPDRHMGLQKCMKVKLYKYATTTPISSQHIQFQHLGRRELFEVEQNQQFASRHGAEIIYKITISSGTEF